MEKNAFKYIGVSLVLTGLAISPASAIAGPSWDGWYTGIALGYSEGDTNLQTRTQQGSYFQSSSVPEVNKTGNGSVNAYGSSLGANLGFNLQQNSFIYGFEVSLAGADIDAKKTKSGIYPCCSPAGFRTERSMSFDWLGTVKGRAGYLINDSLLMYGLAGIAFTDLKVKQLWQDDFNASAKSSSKDFSTGLLIGAGLEHKVLDNWSIKAEYSYINFESQGTRTTMVSETDPFKTKSDLRLHSLNFGIAKYF
jgi:opacity protein-like surface antigen